MFEQTLRWSLHAWHAPAPTLTVYLPSKAAMLCVAYCCLYALDVVTMARMQWIARFSFSFLMIGCYLFYTVYRHAASPGDRLPVWQSLLILVAGALAISLGASGIRERHRRQ